MVRLPTKIVSCNDNNWQDQAHLLGRTQKSPSAVRWISYTPLITPRKLRDMGRDLFERKQMLFDIFCHGNLRIYTPENITGISQAGGSMPPSEEGDLLRKPLKELIFTFGVACSYFFSNSR